MAVADSSTCHFQSLNPDLVSDILTRLDGSTLAAVGSTCSHFRHASSDQLLWQRLCHSTWPSTSSPQAQRIISSSSPIGGFAKFYADSFPLVQYEKSLTHPMNPNISPSDFTSFVDVHYKDKCVFSTVLQGIPNAVDVNDNNKASYNWFSNCPFRLDLLGLGPGKNGSNESNIYDAKHGGDFLEKLAEEVTLSWVMFNKKNARAVNLSSGEPLTVQKSWSSDKEYIMSFGCVVLVEESEVPCKLAECVITARCTIAERGECMRMSEISMSIVDVEGSHINGRMSLVVLNQAIHGSRTNRRVEFERGLKRFKKQREEMKKRRESRESMAEKFCASIEIAVFVALFYGCNALF